MSYGVVKGDTMATKSVERIKARLKENPLYWDYPDYTVKCAKCGGTGKKVPLYRVTNYGRSFSVCKVCNRDFLFP